MVTRIEVRNQETGAELMAESTEEVFSIVISKNAKECSFGRFEEDGRFALVIPATWSYQVTVNKPRDLVMVTVVPTQNKA
jgi:hypothetical protein